MFGSSASVNTCHSDSEHCQSVSDVNYVTTASAIRQSSTSQFKYDTIRKKSLTWTQKLSDQLNPAHVARKNEKEETKTNKRKCPYLLIQYRFKIREGSPEKYNV